MKINSFKAGKVHGYLNYNIDFFPELTFLIGINGAGKTSALKLILGLISPSYQYLNQIEYEYAELVCSTTNDEKDIIITAKQNVKANTFSIGVKSKDINIKPQTIPRYFRLENDTLEIDDFSLMEQNFKEQFDKLETTKAIRELATPKFLGLDRKIYEGRNIDLRLRNRRAYANQKGKRKFLDGYGGIAAIDSSLEDVQFLIFDYFRKIAFEQPKIGEEFKRKIFELSFKFNDDHSLDAVPIDTKELLEKKDKVLAAIKNLDLVFLEASANSFFNKMADVINKHKQIKIDISNGQEVDNNVKPFHAEEFKLLMKWVNNSSQIKRIDEIINFSQTYQEKLADLKSPIKRFESIISKFFNEGQKEIAIANDGEIVVKLDNGKTSSVYELSSGEKQIIIMIAHLIFEEDLKPSGVFIIDEPELSLHIAWQEIFVSSISEASPKTQFILATHSPAIIGDTPEEICQDLAKLN
jgi:predicted ATPase